jgi:FkbM family methyltransferase
LAQVAPHGYSPAGLRARAFRLLVRNAGRPPIAGAAERLRNATAYALGAGTASLHVSESGEGLVLRRLGDLWARRQVTVVDVGAHIGEYASAARSALGPQVTLHCFEPRPDTFDTLEARFAGDHHTICHRIGLGSESGRASLFGDERSSAFTSLHRETFPAAPSRVDEVELRTLDELAAELGIDRIDLLKVDVEGHELAVLEGARGLLRAGRVGAVQFEFGERNLASRTFLRDFFRLLGPDFRFFRVAPGGLRALEYRPAAEVYVLESNYIAVSGDLRAALE